MKYLVHLSPPKDISEKVLALKNELGLVESNAPHVTLCAFRSKEENEADIVRALELIVFEPFSVKLDGFDRFDEDSLVVRLEKERGIVGLHYCVIEKVKPFIDWSETKMYAGSDDSRRSVANVYGSAYVAQFYNPHVTIGHGGCAIPSVNGLCGLSFDACSFLLSKKQDGVWRAVKEFAPK